MKPTPNQIAEFFTAYNYAMSLIEGREDCKTAWRILNKERMTLRMYEETHPDLQGV